MQEPRTTELISRRADAEGRNWGRWCLSDGENPVPPLWKEAGWVRYMKPDESNWDTEKEAPPPPPIHHPSARRVQTVYRSLQLVSRHVMCSYWVGNYIYGRPRTDHETVRLLNALSQAARLDVPPGFQFTLHQYRADIQYIARKVEAAFEVRT